MTWVPGDPKIIPLGYLWLPVAIKRLVARDGDAALERLQERSYSGENILFEMSPFGDPTAVSGGRWYEEKPWKLACRGFSDHFGDGLRHLFIKLSDIEAAVAEPNQTKAKEMVIARPRGRPKNSGGFVAADELLIIRMRALIEANPDLSPSAAARLVIPDAKSSGTEESTIKRLVRRYYNSPSETQRN